jgi:hypothetical protein
VYMNPRKKAAWVLGVSRCSSGMSRTPEEEERGVGGGGGVKVSRIKTVEGGGG